MFTAFFRLAASLQCMGVQVTRLGLVIVLVWIGGLKVCRYEAAGIVPFVANSPLMSFFYRYPAPDYRQHLNKEGEYKPANVAWHEANHTYSFAYGLGGVIVLIGLLIASYPMWPGGSAIGSLLCAVMALTTLSFLFTTSETWVPSLGDAAHGFPYLSAAGRLVIKDVIMLGAALVTMAQAAREHLVRQAARNLPTPVGPSGR